MNKIFRGRRYDTETAQELAYISYSNRRDFNFWQETLYRKRTGEYFLHGEGGASSKYAEKCGQNEWCGGEEIKPLTLEQAQDWAEKNLSADKYEEIFGSVEETGEKQTVSMSLDKGAIEKLKRVSVERGISVSELVCQMAKSL